jgi:hypothetical protein
MRVCSSVLLRESELDTMIQLAHAVKSHRIFVAGSTALDVHRGLYRTPLRHASARREALAAFALPQYDHKVLGAVAVSSLSRMKS